MIYRVRRLRPPRSKGQPYGAARDFWNIGELSGLKPITVLSDSALSDPKFDTSWAFAPVRHPACVILASSRCSL